ncbi:MAG: cold shock domain-containing protein [Flavobacteriaceae bacterium]|nr:cold shock domain-containing protein [Flavobacteriaceae bacterium]
MKQGTVKFFNDSKGYGFITEDDSGAEYFVHISGLSEEIKQGDAVEFELKEGKKGMNAVNVKVI